MCHRSLCHTTTHLQHPGQQHQRPQCRPGSLPENPEYALTQLNRVMWTALSFQLALATVTTAICISWKSHLCSHLAAQVCLKGKIYKHSSSDWSRVQRDSASVQHLHPLYAHGKWTHLLKMIWSNVSCCCRYPNAICIHCALEVRPSCLHILLPFTVEALSAYKKSGMLSTWCSDSCHIEAKLCVPNAWHSAFTLAMSPSLMIQVSFRDFVPMSAHCLLLL